MISSGFADRVYPTTKLEPIVALLNQKGVSPAGALASIGLGEAAVNSPHTRVSIDQVLAFYEQAIALMKGARIGYEAGQRFHATTYGMYGFAILSSTDYRRALNFAVEYHRLGTPLADCTFVEQGREGAWLLRPIPHPSLVGALYEFVVEQYFGILTSLHQDLLGPDFRPKVLGVTYPLADKARADLAAASGAPVVACEDNRLVFDAARLSEPTRKGSPAVNRMLIDICNAELDQLRRREGLSGQVRELLIVNGCRPRGIGALAAGLKLSERSLRRRLAEEGTSLRALQDELRLQAAVRFLRDTAMTIEDIAETLGFSDASNFRRAFRRWTGHAPQAYRER